MIALAALGTAAVVGLASEGVVLLANHRSDAPPRPAAKPRPSPSPVAHLVTGPLRSPFTGERVKTLNPVLAVKIGNTVAERPAVGLSDADLVYLIPVEGGLSRILAVFSSHFPRVIGPVRSARQDDIRLLRQFRRPAFAFSGAQPELLPRVENARVVDLYDGKVGGYFRSSNRAVPYNLFASTRRLLAESHGASKARDIGFRFGTPPPGGRPKKSMSVSYPAASFRFTWAKAQGRWRVWMDGARAITTEAGQMSAPTVVVQYTKVPTSKYVEQNGRPPYAVTTGSGRAVVLRDGMAYQAHWSRPSPRDGTTFTTDSGQPMTFARGPVWIVLTDAKSWRTAYPGMY